MVGKLKTGTTLTLTSIIAEGILYGFSFHMFGLTIWALIYKRTSPHVNRVMVVLTCALCVSSTLHIIAECIHMFQGFASSEDPEAYFTDATKITFKNAVYTVQTLIGDGVLVYRCYLIWNNAWVVIPLCGLWVAVGVTGFHMVWSLAETRADNNPFVSQSAHWALSFFSITFVTNLLTTSLLAYKIWTVNRAVSRIVPLALQIDSKLLPVKMLIMECGALYSVSLIALITTYATESPSFDLVANMITQIIAITFYILIIRAAMARMTEEEKRTVITTHLHFSNHSKPSHGREVDLNLSFADRERREIDERGRYISHDQTELGETQQIYSIEELKADALSSGTWNNAV